MACLSPHSLPSPRLGSRSRQNVNAPGPRLLDIPCSPRRPPGASVVVACSMHNPDGAADSSPLPRHPPSSEMTGGNNICPASRSPEWRVHIQPQLGHPTPPVTPTKQTLPTGLPVQQAGGVVGAAAQESDALRSPLGPETNGGRNYQPNDLQLFMALGEADDGLAAPGDVSFFLSHLHQQLTFREAWRAAQLADLAGLMIPHHVAKVLQEGLEERPTQDTNQWPPASVTDVLSSRPLPEALQLLHGLELQPSSEWTSAALKLWLKGQGSKLTVAEVHDLMNSLCLMYDFDSVAGVHTALDTPPGEVPLLPGSRPGAPTNPWETLSCTAVPDDEAGMMSMPAGSPRRRSGSLGGSRRYSRGSSGGGALAAQASSGSMSGLACDCVEEDPVQCLRQWLDQAVGALLDNGVLMAHQLQDLYSTLSCLSITPSTGTVLRLYADAYPPSHPGSIATLLWLSALAGVQLPPSIASQELQLLELSLLTLDIPQAPSSTTSASHHAAADDDDALAALPTALSPRDAYLVVWVMRHYNFTPAQHTAVEVLAPVLTSVLAPHHEYTPSQCAIVMRGLLACFPECMAYLLGNTDLSPLLRGWDSLSARELLVLLQDIGAASRHMSSGSALFLGDSHDSGSSSSSSGSAQPGGGTGAATAPRWLQPGAVAGHPPRPRAGASSSSSSSSRASSGSGSGGGLQDSRFMHLAAYVVLLSGWATRARMLSFADIISSLQAILDVFGPVVSQVATSSSSSSSSPEWDGARGPGLQRGRMAGPAGAGSGSDFINGHQPHESSTMYLAQHVMDSWLRHVLPVLQLHIRRMTASSSPHTSSGGGGSSSSNASSSHASAHDHHIHQQLAPEASFASMASSTSGSSSSAALMGAEAMAGALTALHGSLRFLDGRRHQFSVRSLVWCMQRLGMRAGICSVHPQREFKRVPDLLLAVERVGWVEPPLEWLQAVLDYPSSTWFDAMSWQEAVDMLGAAARLEERCKMEAMRQRGAQLQRDVDAGAGTSSGSGSGSGARDLDGVPVNISGSGYGAGGGEPAAALHQQLQPATVTAAVGVACASDSTSSSTNGLVVLEVAGSFVSQAAVTVGGSSGTTWRQHVGSSSGRAAVEAAEEMRARLLQLFEQRMESSLPIPTLQPPVGMAASAMPTATDIGAAFDTSISGSGSQNSHHHHLAGRDEPHQWDALQAVVAAWQSQGQAADVRAVACVMRVVRARLQAAGMRLEEVAEVPALRDTLRQLQALSALAAADDELQTMFGGMAL